jgi:hypothetical protein
MKNVLLAVSIAASLNSCRTSSGVASTMQSAASDPKSFECVMGTPGWFGHFNVNLHVLGGFDDHSKLQKILRITQGDTTQTYRYDVVDQTMSSTGQNPLLFVKADHEDGAAFYHNEITVSNQAFTGNTENYSVQKPASGSFFNASFTSHDLQNHQTSGTGSCYCPACAKVVHN